MVFSHLIKHIHTLSYHYKQWGLSWTHGWAAGSLLPTLGVAPIGQRLLMDGEGDDLAWLMSLPGPWGSSPCGAPKASDINEMGASWSQVPSGQRSDSQTGNRPPGSRTLAVGRQSPVGT